MTRNELYVGIDVIEDEWIEDIESLDAKLREFTERKK